MQIFDFKDGIKGKLIGTAPATGYSSGWLEKGVSGKVYRITLTKSPFSDTASQVQWTSGAGSSDHTNGDNIPLTPKDFHTDAIIFCTGKFRTGLDKGVWTWEVVGTKEWNRAALKSGILTASHSKFQGSARQDRRSFHRI